MKIHIPLVPSAYRSSKAPSLKGSHGIDIHQPQLTAATWNSMKTMHAPLLPLIRMMYVGCVFTAGFMGFCLFLHPDLQVFGTKDYPRLGEEKLKHMFDWSLLRTFNSREHQKLVNDDYTKWGKYSD